MSNTLFFANVLGYIGAVMLFLQIVMGSRHIFKYFKTDTVSMNAWHKYLGIYGTLFVFVHPIEEMYVYMSSWSWIYTPNFIIESEMYITFGRFALLLALLVWITSAIVREQIKWTPWKYIHLLSYPLFAMVFMHAVGVGTIFENYLWVQIIWYIMFAIFVIVVILRLLAWSGYSKMKYVIKDFEFYGPELVVIKLAPTDSNKIMTAKIGQNFYLQSDRFKSEHPFTIMEQNKENGELVFAVRKVGNFWNEIVSKEVNSTIYIDGPYGVFTAEGQNSDTKVLISGGVGVTPFVELAKYYGDNAYYVNCNRNINEAIRRDEIKSSVYKYLDIFNETDNVTAIVNGGIIKGVITADILQQFVGTDIANAKYFICGSPKYTLIVCDILKSLGVSKSKIYFEALGF